MIVRKVSPKDIDIILKFQFLLHKHESKFDKLQFDKDKFRKNTLKALFDTSVAYFIAYHNKKSVGFSEVYLKGKIAIMSSSYVLSKFRNKGFGRALFNARKNWAKRKGAKKLQLEVYKNNVNTIKVWKNLGYQRIKTNNNSIIMEQDLVTN